MKTTLPVKVVRKRARIKSAELQAYSHLIPAGPAVKVRGPNPPIALGVLVAGLVGLIAKNFVAANYFIPNYPLLDALLKFEVLPTAGVASVLAAALAAFVVRRQLMINLRPNIVFSAGPGSPVSLEKRPSSKYWSVSISNFGLGPAIIVRAFYSISTLNQDKNFVEFPQAWASLEVNLDEYDDFVLYRYTEGAAVPSGKSLPLFECDVGKTKRHVAQVAVIVWYRGIMGDLYAKRIECFPAYWGKFGSQVSNASKSQGGKVSRTKLRKPSEDVSNA